MNSLRNKPHPLPSYQTPWYNKSNTNIEISERRRRRKNPKREGTISTNKKILHCLALRFAPKRSEKRKILSIHPSSIPLSSSPFFPPPSLSRVGREKQGLFKTWGCGYKKPGKVTDLSPKRRGKHLCLFPTPSPLPPRVQIWTGGNSARQRPLLLSLHPIPLSQTRRLAGWYRMVFAFIGGRILATSGCRASMGTSNVGGWVRVLRPRFNIH